MKGLLHYHSNRRGRDYPCQEKHKSIPRNKPDCGYCHTYFNRHNGVCKTCGKDHNKKVNI